MNGPKKYIDLEEAVKIMRDPHMDLQEVRVPKGITELLDILQEALNQIMDNGEERLRELEYVEVWEMTEEK